MIRLKSIIEGVQRDKYYYVQHLLDLDPTDAVTKLLDDLEKNSEKWTKMYDPQLQGNEYGWHPSATLSMGEYGITLTPNMYREGNRFVIFSVEITVTKTPFAGRQKPKVIKTEEEPLNISSPEGRDWDFSSLQAKLANIVRSVKELIKKDYD